MHRRFVSKLLIYSLLTLYLVLDIMVFQGPLYRNLKELGVDGAEELGSDRERGIVARVFRRPIYLSQVDWRVDEMLWSSGQTRKEVPEKMIRSYRRLAVEKLVDFELLREKVKLSKKEYLVAKEAVDEAMRRFVSRFSNEQDMMAIIRAQGLDGIKEMKLRVEAMLQQELYLERQIASALEVSDDDLAQWLESHKEHFYLAERRKVRHVFLAALQNEESVALEKLETALKDLSSGAKKFEQLATWSEDERSKTRGGLMGWVTRERLDADFGAAVFDLPLEQPQVLKSRLGWHLVEVLASEDRQARSAEDSAEEVILAIQAERRPEVIRVYRQKLRRRHQRYVKIDWPSLGWEKIEH